MLRNIDKSASVIYNIGKKMQKIALKVFEILTSKKLTIIECLTVNKIVEQSLLKLVEKDGEENGNETETIQD